MLPLIQIATAAVVAAAAAVAFAFAVVVAVFLYLKTFVENLIGIISPPKCARTLSLSPSSTEIFMCTFYKLFSRRIVN